MPMHDTYLLHIYRSRAVSGWQWAARVDHPRGGENLRFTHLEALVAYLQTELGGGEPSDQPLHTIPGADDPATTVKDGGA